MGRVGAATCANHFSLEISNILFLASLEVSGSAMGEYSHCCHSATATDALMVPMQCLFQIQDLQTPLFELNMKEKERRLEAKSYKIPKLAT